MQMKSNTIICYSHSNQLPASYYWQARLTARGILRVTDIQNAFNWFTNKQAPCNHKPVLMLLINLVFTFQLQKIQKVQPICGFWELCLSM